MSAQTEQQIPAAWALATVTAQLRSAGCVFAEEEALVLLSEAPTPARLAAMVESRTAGVPLEHLVGWAEFCGLRILVERGVFVPRRRTELVVREAVGLARDVPRRPVVAVDMCCGSGAIGAALAAAVDGVELHAVDVDPASVRCARRNVADVGGQVYAGDLYEPLPSTLLGRVDLLVANAPYVPTDAIAQMPAEARLHEPRVALDGGDDGLDIHRRIIADAATWLSPGGHVLVETSTRQARTDIDILSRSGFDSRVLSFDELDATVVLGTRPPVEPTSGGT
jgi:release factor glutamine methyltransferase